MVQDPLVISISYIVIREKNTNVGCSSIEETCTGEYQPENNSMVEIENRNMIV